jgi:transcriptional regulator with XRE-family HTH domain
MNILTLSPAELCEAIGKRAKERRLGMDLRQADVAERAGVTLRTIRRFEAGEGSLEIAARVAFALGAEREFLDLFPPHDGRTLDDVLAANRRRQRARR